MKRYASHFLFLPRHGYLKQYVLEIGKNGIVRICPLSEEIENTEWLPGVIVLLDNDRHTAIPDLSKEIFPLFDREEKPVFLLSVPESVEEEIAYSVPYLLFPFDFTAMQPVSETRHKLLR
ncbi:hypothetical protein [Bacteroides helcogenes]|uniref:Uncharacterized protein n=1 Tax=Bacteroides helcogenes (strain ATCC 35417 / DSM 20613 / JCM 6297 / CCUG 15421 / P 36-108) TaxID=693979 RepID=E6SU40_BACT6|nr:hypothetical protein [Bacteroides helcogenes]ADV44313.1 hypothetical protein Bache_2345 [Bacteroides helcogenes P 36-108]MDY5238277.1 hypothetical protein [Bacteroides helcogenes]